MRSRAAFLSIVLLFAFLLSLLVTLGAGASVVLTVKNMESMEEWISGISESLSRSYFRLPGIKADAVPFVLVCWFFLSLLNTLMIAQARKALRQVRKERPFSEKCGTALRTAAVARLLIGLFWIAVMLYYYFTGCLSLIRELYPEDIIRITACAVVLVFLLNIPHLAGSCFFSMLSEISRRGSVLEQTCTLSAGRDTGGEEVLSNS